MVICTILLQFIGLAMVLDFALGAQDEMLEEDDEADSPRGKGLEEDDEEADSPRDPFIGTTRGTPRRKTICRIIIRAFVISITLPILLWTVYMGYELVNRPAESKAESLALVVGVITMAFGIALLLNGIVLAKELSQELSTLMQLPEF